MQINTIVAGIALALALSSTALAECVPKTIHTGWLLDQEEAGGITIRSYTGKTDRQLVASLLVNPNEPSVGSFPNFGNAEWTISILLSFERDLINRWALRAGAGENYAFTGSVDYVVGRVASLSGDLKYVADTKSIRGVLEADGTGGCFLQKSQPNLAADAKN